MADDTQPPADFKAFYLGPLREDELERAKEMGCRVQVLEGGLMLIWAPPPLAAAAAGKESDFAVYYDLLQQGPPMPPQQEEESSDPTESQVPPTNTE